MCPIIVVAVVVLNCLLKYFKPLTKTLKPNKHYLLLTKTKKNKHTQTNKYYSVLYQHHFFCTLPTPLCLYFTNATLFVLYLS